MDAQFTFSQAFPMMLTLHVGGLKKAMDELTKKLSLEVET
jgi:hypothetical protein